MCTAPDEGLHQILARTAATSPDAVALTCGQHETTYQALDRTADAWASSLMAAGVTRGAIVPVCLPRGTELVIALLAILKTGAAYALLDPHWPERRLLDVMAQLSPPLIVAESADGVFGGVPRWSPPNRPIAPPPGWRPTEVSGSDPCCVFFTSGTTGRPKGVVTPHRATARLFQPNSFVRFTAETVMALAAPVPWDAFSLELWSVLLNGGTSVIVEEPYLSPAALRDVVSRHRTDTVWLTSSLFNMIVDEDEGAFLGLRQVMIGGERLSTTHVGQFLRTHPGIALTNGYGPVESTVFATTHRIVQADCERPGGIPVGRPVPGTHVHVMDGSRTCAVGETGEICLAGDGLALHYLGDPALTEKAFPRLWLGDDEVRVYRTGDLGVWGTDGLLYYVGRADRQLKIRGHRVEPAEIERQVERSLPSVRSCRVLARKDAWGAAKELIAFCVPTRPDDPLEDVVDALRSVLTSYQRPATVVSVNRFPVTERGKLDERALLELAGDGPPGTAFSSEPAVPSAPAHGPAAQHITDATLQAVVGAFRQVLGRDAISPDIPFTALGGTSLAAGRVCARLAARLGRPVPVSRLHQYPTAAALADWLRETTVPDRPREVRTPPHTHTASLTPMQVVHLTRTLIDPSDRTSHCLLTWVIEGDLDRAALRSAISEVHGRHESLRAVYTPDPRPCALLADTPPPALDVLPAEPSAEAAVDAVRAHLSEELDPVEGDVWRTVLVPVQRSATTVFGCVVHHIAFDGWSEAVLAGDLAEAYNAARGAVVRGRPLPPSLAAVDQERLRGQENGGLTVHRDYLLAELADVPVMRWPADTGERVPGPPGSVLVALPPSVLADVDALAARAGVTRFVVLLSQWAAGLAETTGQRDFAVGVPVAHRYAPGLERAVGCHIDVSCVRLRGAAVGGDERAVAETGRIVARAFAAQDVPFTDVLTMVDPPAARRPPLYQTLFALQDNAHPDLGLLGPRTTFVRQPYLALPLELHTEFWPEADGGLRLDVSFQPDAVSPNTARELAKRLGDRLRATTSERL
ncbi:amino acid adenylation domain-containing protein [Streptomyces sp. NPDC056835]|uniref:amino acid adenylation domain-containing protein n=1 Tax=Streptomyces sp. NPDC056835 TaxID=3345956 RepID=UPI0036931E60